MKKIVISLGGSVIIPNKVDYKFLDEFKKLILKYSKTNKIVIVTGGGSTARDYIKSLKKINKYEKFLNFVGIAATRLNARLVGGVFGIRDKVPENLNQVNKLIKKRNIVICGALGMQQEMTSDGNAAQISKMISADYFINISNVKGLFNKDPRKYKNAKLIKRINFEDFDKILNKLKFKPGQHFILDHSASKIIMNNKIKTILIGKNLNNLKNLLEDRGFIGTVIS